MSKFKNKSIRIWGFQLRAPIFRLPSSDSQLRLSVSRLRSSVSRLPTSNFCLPTSNFQLPGILVGLFVVILQGLFIAPVQSQSLDDYLQLAAENNPEVKAYFHEYLASVEQISQAGALPDPELSIGFFFKPMDRLMGRQQADIQLMQMFPWFGMQGVQRDEADKMSRVRYQLFEDAKNRLFYEVKNKWYALYQLNEEIRILEEKIEILKTYERLALIRFQNAGAGTASGGMSASGGANSKAAATAMRGMDGSNSAAGSNSSAVQGSMASSGAPAPMQGVASPGMSSVLRIRMQSKEMESNLAFLHDSYEVARAEFNQLLNRQHDEEVQVADTLGGAAILPAQMAFIDSISSNNPMLGMLDAELAVYGSQQEMARLAGRPMLGVGVNYMPFLPREADGMNMGGKDMVMPMVSVSLPIYRKKYNAMAKQAELSQIAVQQRRENTLNQLAVQWRSSVASLDDAVRRTDLYHQQTALARQALRLSLSGYSTNGQGFEDVLQIQQELLDYQLKLVKAIVQQHTAIANLEMLVATELMQ